MRLAPALMLLATACAAPAAESASATLAGASRSAQPSQDAQAVLEVVLATETNVPEGITIDDVTLGDDALRQPLPEDTQLPRLRGFVDARLVRLGTSGAGSYWEEGGYVTWGAAYLSAAEATAAFDVLAADFQGEDGWAMARLGDPSLGDESLTVEGTAYGFDTNRLHIWRAGNLLLAVVAVGDTTATSDEGLELLGAIAEDVNDRVVALP
jgi:hypothetical protein